MRQRRFWGVLVSLVIPGAGHFLIGRPWRGVAWYAVGFASVLLLPVASWMPLAFSVLLTRFAAAVEVGVLRDVRRTRGRMVLGAWIGLVAFGFLSTRVIRATYLEAFKIPAGSMIPTLQIGDHIFINKLADVGAGDVAVFVHPCEPDRDFVKRVVAEGGDTVEVRCGRLYVNDEPVKSELQDGACAYWDYRDETQRWERQQASCYRETLGGHTYTIVQDRRYPALLERARAVSGAAYAHTLRERDFPGDRPPSCATIGGVGEPVGTLEPSAGGSDDPCAPTRHYVVPDDHVFVLGDNRVNSSDSRIWGPVPVGHIEGKAFLIWWSSRPAAQGGVDWSRIDRPIE